MCFLFVDLLRVVTILLFVSQFYWVRYAAGPKDVSFGASGNLY